MYLPHARYALESDLVQKDEDNRINVEWRFGMCLFSDGRYIEAEISFVQVMETRKRVLGMEHPSTLASMNNLAFTRKGQDRDKEAITLMKECVQLRERVLGPDHHLTSSSRLVLNRWESNNVKLVSSNV